MRRLLILLPLLIVAFAAPAAPAAAAPRDITSVELELLRLVNEYRASLGLRPVLLSHRLQVEARWYAQDMAAHDFVDHDHIDSLRRDLWTRLADFGYAKDKGRSAQNWGVGTPSAGEIFMALKASPPHDRTMREETYRVTGVALAENPGTLRRWYWVQTFGVYDDRRDGTAVLPVPAVPKLRVSGCRGGTRILRCPAGRAIRLTATAPTRRRRLELRLRGRKGGWGPVVDRPATTRVRLRPGETLKVRALTSVRGPARTLRAVAR